MEIVLSFVNPTNNLSRKAGVPETATSLSRVLNHAKKSAIGGISAFRDNRSLAENRKLNKELENKIRKAGFGFTKVKGRFIENKGTENETVVDGEESFILFAPAEQHGNLLGFLKKVAANYEQDAVLFKRNDEKDAKFVYTNGPRTGETESVGEFSAKAIGDYLSVLKSSEKKGKENTKAFEFRQKTDKEKEADTQTEKRRNKNALLDVGKKTSQAETKWWESLSKKEQEAYLKEHPNSKRKVTKSK